MPASRAAALAKHFRANHPEPASPQHIRQLETDVQAAHQVPAKVPPELEALWGVAREWHLLRAHYDVFGVNIPRPSDLLRRAEDVFGGRRGREEWGAAVGPEDGGGHSATVPQCHSAAAGWLPVAVTSEFDFVFMNFNPDAEGPMGWGATRHVVNNCAEDTPFTPAPAANFLNRVEELVRSLPPREDGDEDDDKFCEALDSALHNFYHI